MTPDLYQLLDTLDPHADRVTRNLWLARLLQWIRGQARDARAAAGRVELLLDALQARPECRARVQALWVQTFTTVDASIVLSDFGLPSRAAFVGELVDRIQLKLLPASPDTADGGELFGQLLHTPFDGQWLDALGAPTVERLAALLHIPATPSAAALDSHWKQALAQAITFCTSQIRAIGFSVEVRARLPDVRVVRLVRQVEDQQEGEAVGGRRQAGVGEVLEKAPARCHDTSGRIAAQ